MLHDEYQDIAPYYEKILARPFFQLRKNICTFIHHHRHHKVIDICCGTGTQLKMLDAPDMELIGVDLSQAMLSQAALSRNIALYQHDATEIMFPDASFDAALLSFALHEKSALDREIMLNKCMKLLRQGGHLIVADFCHVPPTPLGLLMGKAIIPLIEKKAGKNHFQNYKNWMATGAIEKALEKISRRIDVISTHFHGTVILCSLCKLTEFEIAVANISVQQYDFKR